MFLVQTENDLRLLLIIISIISSNASFCALPNVSSRTQANEHGQDTRDDDHQIAVARRVMGIARRIAWNVDSSAVWLLWRSTVVEFRSHATETR